MCRIWNGACESGRSTDAFSISPTLQENRVCDVEHSHGTFSMNFYAVSCAGKHNLKMQRRHHSEFGASSLSPCKF